MIINVHILTLYTFSILQINYVCVPIFYVELHLPQKRVENNSNYMFFQHPGKENYMFRIDHFPHKITLNMFGQTLLSYFHIEHWHNLDQHSVGWYYTTQHNTTQHHTKPHHKVCHYIFIHYNVEIRHYS